MATTIKYNPQNGDSVWVKRDTGYKYAGSSNIKIDTMGNIYITGGTNNVPPGSDVDILTIKYSPSGNKDWIITYNGPFNGTDGGFDLYIDKLNNIYVLGSSQSGSQISDYIVIKYSQLIGISHQIAKIPKNFILYQNFPNPFNPSSIIKFSLPKKSFVQIKVYDLLGKLKEIMINKELQFGEYEELINSTKYPSGVYFYQLTADGNIIDTKKFVVIK